MAEREGDMPLLSNARLRWALLLGGMGLLYLWVRSHGLLEHATVEGVRAWVRAAGPWGGLGYLGLYCAGVLMYIPGMVFVVAGIVAFGPLIGAPLAFICSVVAGTLSVWFLQKIGGALLHESESAWVRRSVAKLHERPVRTIAVLRMMLMISPLLNVPLAMAGVKVRDNALGTALGMVPVVLLSALFVDAILSLIGV